MAEQYDVARAFIAEVESELRQMQLWADCRPSDEALASELPFCVDSLGFEQWLQFVFIERMQALVDAGRPLPQRFGLAPMSEQYFSSRGVDSTALNELLERLDETL